MRILLVTATFTELAPVLGRLHLQGEAGQRLKSATLGVLEVDVLMTGVGAVATAYHLGRQLLQKKYDFVINAGICGTFDTTLELGTVVNITSDRFADLGAEDGPNFLSVFDLNLIGANEFPFIRKQLFNEHWPDVALMRGLPTVSAITVNTVSGDEHTIDQLKQAFQPQTESMEGAAFLYCCLLEKIPCAQIRAISNRVERRNRDTWQMGLAIRNLNDSIHQLIEQLAS